MVIAWGTVADFATASGIVVGGIFAYFKFLRARLYRPRLDFDVKIQDARESGMRVLEWSIRNVGQGVIRLAPRAPSAGNEPVRGPAILDVDYIEEPAWRDAMIQHDGSVLWNSGTHLALDLVQPAELPLNYEYMILYQKRRKGLAVEPECRLGGAILLPWDSRFVAARVFLTVYYWQGARVLLAQAEQAFGAEPLDS